MQSFRDCSTDLGLILRVLCADLRHDLSAACQQADEAWAVPKCTSADYVPALLEICRKEHVALLVPTIDTELPVLSGHTTDFQANGTRVVISAPEVIRVARDKLMTVRTLEKVGVPTPRTLVLKDYRKNPSAISGPVIAKPVGGSASIGLVRGQGPADFAALPQEGYLVQECWDGIEYTVNVFFDQQGELRCAVPHRRIEVRAGEVSKGRTERVPQLEEAARKIAAALPGARGPLCFQAIVKDSGEYAVFEINARFGGGYPLTHHAGARFAQWLLEEAAGMPCTANNDWKAGVTMLRYDAAVFVDD
jgi:carbamoyl-phosphate synthase large subunit